MEEVTLHGWRGCSTATVNWWGWRGCLQRTKRRTYPPFRRCCVQSCTVRTHSNQCVARTKRTCHWPLIRSSSRLATHHRGRPIFVLPFCPQSFSFFPLFLVREKGPVQVEYCWLVSLRVLFYLLSLSLCVLRLWPCFLVVFVTWSWGTGQNQRWGVCFWLFEFWRGLVALPSL